MQTQFTLTEGDTVTVQLRHQDVPVVERGTVTEVFRGEHRMSGRDFDFFAFSVDGFGTFVLDPNSFVTKHPERN